MKPSRRTLLTGAAASLSVAGRFRARAADIHTLRFIPQADVTILDPLTTTAYPTRNHGHMCWDTLYGLDTNFVPSPQLVSGHVVEDDGRRWTFALREGTTFHDGEPVRARDAVACRWFMDTPEVANRADGEIGSLTISWLSRADGNRCHTSSTKAAATRSRRPDTG